MTKTPISLSKFRKAKKRTEARAKSDANAVKFGRTKAERMQDKARADKETRQLDGHLRYPNTSEKPTQDQ